jgi:hypothetical protein
MFFDYGFKSARGDSRVKGAVSSIAGCIALLD